MSRVEIFPPGEEEGVIVVAVMRKRDTKEVAGEVAREIRAGGKN